MPTGVALTNQKAASGVLFGQIAAAQIFGLNTKLRESVLDVDESRDDHFADPSDSSVAVYTSSVTITMGRAQYPRGAFGQLQWCDD